MVNKYIVNGLWRECKREKENIFKGSLGYVGGMEYSTGNSGNLITIQFKESLLAVHYIV